MDYPKSVPGVGLVNGKFVDENKATGQIGSLIPAAWGNAVTDEICSVIRAAGLEPNEVSAMQLIEALRKMFAPLDSPKLTGVPTSTTPDASDDSTRVATTAFVQAVAGSKAIQDWVKKTTVRSFDEVPYWLTTNNERSDAWLTINGKNRGRLWTDQSFDPNSKVSKSGGDMTGELKLQAGGAEWDGQIWLKAWTGEWTRWRARRGGGIELINNAYDAVTFGVDDFGNVTLRGTTILQPDGNVFLKFRNVWLSAILDDLYNRDNTKASAGARVQWDSGLAEFDYVGSVNSNIHGQIDLPAPWVVTGLRVNASTSSITAIWPRGVVMRNQ